MPASHRVQAWAAWLAMLVMLFAGLLKFSDLGQFAEDLAAWRILPDNMISAIAIVAACVEVLLGVLWLARVGRSWVLVASVAWLSALTTLYAMQWMVGGPVPCGCLGRASFADSGWALVARNLVLIALLGVGWWQQTRPEPSVPLVATA